ncbi:MAG: hypothetical protein KGI97_04430 [Alphaproteobacteria bacterium]|nr:hypothetical protein [Alphaproteobacteria bacterium]
MNIFRNVFSKINITVDKSAKGYSKEELEEILAPLFVGDSPADTSHAVVNGSDFVHLSYAEKAAPPEGVPESEKPVICAAVAWLAECDPSKGEKRVTLEEAFSTARDLSEKLCHVPVNFNFGDMVVSVTDHDTLQNFRNTYFLRKTGVRNTPTANGHVNGGDVSGSAALEPVRRDGIGVKPVSKPLSTAEL